MLRSTVKKNLNSVKFENMKTPVDTKDRYHHGALQQALIEATEAILTERGLEGFTLREAARRAGVSPAAPAHHFGSVAGLLTEVAVLGFRELTRYLREGMAAGGSDPAARLRAQGVAYVRFAFDYPARFLLMFRCDRLSKDDEGLHEAGQTAFAELQQAMRDYVGLEEDEAFDQKAFGKLLGAWSSVHGFAQLALDGKFDHMAGPGGRAGFVAEMLPAMLEELFP